MTSIRNVGLWLLSVVLACGTLASFYGTLYGWPTLLFVFRVALLSALPVAGLYLPFVIALKDAQGRRLPIIAASGVLIGPLFTAAWGLILQLQGRPHVWGGDLPLGIGGYFVTILALITGSIATAFYISALKILD